MKKPVLELRPTQFAVGQREVARKVAELKSFGHAERHDFLHARPVPVVRGPRKHWHLIDHHHHARACWELGLEEIPVEVKADLSHLGLDAFWEEMRRSRWAHLHDQFGKGPHPPHLLPEDVRGLADDPFRSLAWALRHSGAYEKTAEAFAEFLWADFLRGELAIEPGDEGFASALKKAEALAREPKAARLPGYRAR